MKIAQIAPLAIRVPPKKYGGTERVVHALTEELVRRGHNVTLFASGDSITSATLRSCVPLSLREAGTKDPYAVNSPLLLHMGIAYAAHAEFDIIHDHLIPSSLPLSNLVSTPVVATMHGPFIENDRPLFNTLRKTAIVTISKAQMNSLYLSSFNHVRTIHHGLPMGSYPFVGTPDDYMLFVGRIDDDKGVRFAIDTAELLDRRLLIAAKIDPENEAYYREYVHPRLSKKIQLIGEVDEVRRNELMSRALCLLHPVVFFEPFGLTLIEAAACGCPVIAFDRGSIPEIVKDSETGFVVKDVTGMARAVDSIHTIDRNVCRENALTNFSATRMADDYERVYASVIATQNAGLRGVNS